MKTRFYRAAFALLVVVHPAHSDISYDQHIKVEAAGVMSMAASEGDVTTLISKDKSRTDSAITMKSQLAGIFAGSGKSGTIVRLDKSVMWNLLPDKQQYSELTFAEAKAQMDKARQSMQQAQSSGTAGGVLPVTAEGCQWSKGDVHVEHPGKTEIIAGLKADQHIIRLQQSCTDPSTSKTCDITWLMETWLADDVPGTKEVLSFKKAYMQAMGLGDVMSQVQGPGQSLLSMFASNWKDVGHEFEKLHGYPLRTVMQMGIGGEQCTTAEGKPIALDHVWSDASTAAYNAAINEAGSEAGSAVGRAAGESLGNSVAGSIGGAAVGAAAGQLIGGLTGMFTKAASEPAPAEPAANTANAQVTAFRITTEVTNWSNAAISGERFNLPVGWKKL
jgi:hypothetical protein